MRSVARLNCETLRPSTLLAKGVVSSDMPCIATRKEPAPALEEMILLSWRSSLMFFVLMTCSVWKIEQNLMVSPNSCGHLGHLGEGPSPSLKSWGHIRHLWLRSCSYVLQVLALMKRRLKDASSTYLVSWLALQSMEAQNSASFQVAGQDFFNDLNNYHHLYSNHLVLLDSAPGFGVQILSTMEVFVASWVLRCTEHFLSMPEPCWTLLRDARSTLHKCGLCKLEHDWAWCFGD